LKLHLDRSSQLLVSSYGSDHVTVGAVRYTNSLIITPREVFTEWPAVSFEALQPSHFERLAELRPGLVVLGTGQRLRFPSPSTLAPLYAAGIGVEVMDLHAACRTYNILAGEGRDVAAALLIESPGAA
jgi:uncharacterized protein